MPLSGGQRLGGLHGTAQRLVRGGRRRRGDPGRGVEAPVDAGDDGPEQRDPERRPQLVRGLRDGGRGSGVLLGDAGEDHVGGDGEGEARTDADDQEHGTEQRIGRLLVDDGDDGEGQADAGEPAGHHGAHREAPCGPARQQPGDHRADGGGQFGEPRLQRAAALDQLQELGEEEDQAGQAEDGQQVGEDRAGEAPVVEEPHVQQWLGQPELAPYERHEGEDADDGRTGYAPARAVRRRLLDGVDDADHADEGEHDAEQVPGAGGRVLRLGDHLDADDHQDGHDRQVDQEDRTPPEVLQQHPADDRADGRARGGHGAPDADGEAAFARVVEEVADEGEGGRHQGGTGDAEQRPGRDHHRGAGRIGVEHGDRAERHGPAEEQLLASDAVAEAAHGDQEAGDDEGVDVADPQQLGAGRPQVLTEERGGQAEDGGVDGDEQHGQDEDGEGDPPPRGPRLVRRGGLLEGGTGGAHCSTLRRAPPSSNSAIMCGKSWPATRPAWTAQAPAPMSA